MNTRVTSEQIEFYRKNGFLIVDDFLNGVENGPPLPTL